jgi:hypothetical protein
VDEGISGDPKEILRQICKLALFRALGDKVANVFHAGVKLLRKVVSAYGPQAGPRESQYCVGDLIPPLLEKTGDSNTRMKDAALDALHFLAGSPTIGMSCLAPHLLRPIKNQNQWKPFLGRLTLLHEFIESTGLSKGSDGLTVENVMTFVVKAFDNPNNEVRSTGVKVALLVQKLDGKSIERHLPKNVKQGIKDQLGIGAGQIIGGGGAAAAAPSAPPAKQAHPAASKPVKGKPEPAPLKAIPKHAPPPNAKAAPKAPVPAAPPLQPHEMSSAELEAELGRRRKALGKDHPDVAHALVDLAHAHSDGENYPAAQKALEEALRIQEQARILSFFTKNFS